MSLYAALVIVVLFGVAGVVVLCVALYEKEIKAAFLFIPGAVLFFYAGLTFGYFIGLPYFFSWLLEWAAQALRPTCSCDKVITVLFYFGAVFWRDHGYSLAGIGLIKSSLGTPDQPRKVAAGHAGCDYFGVGLSPPDIMSQVALFFPMVFLFEVGLFFGPFFIRRSQR